MTLWKRLAVVAPLALLMGTAPTVTLAASPCAADVKKFCSNVQPGAGRIKKCLEAHQAELSDACKARVQNPKPASERQHACAADARKFCKGVRPGGGRIAQCLKDHEAELSPECKAGHKAMQQTGVNPTEVKPATTPQPAPTK